jgi:hypothetical protein
MLPTEYLLQPILQIPSKEMGIGQVDAAVHEAKAIGRTQSG